MQGLIWRDAAREWVPSGASCCLTWGRGLSGLLSSVLSVQWGEGRAHGASQAPALFPLPRLAVLWCPGAVIPPYPPAGPGVAAEPSHRVRWEFSAQSTVGSGTAHSCKGLSQCGTGAPLGCCLPPSPAASYRGVPEDPPCFSQDCLLRCVISRVVLEQGPGAHTGLTSCAGRESSVLKCVACAPHPLSSLRVRGFPEPP